ncbi:hypothetical protein CK203_007243 [Vitis vinifera]|uniref:DUF4283 domain-containing protein n=1 Tax=Vitis vinifera TaxID=29760 RepID=A0A438G0T6_VITVI|nr:hypothetical protein CK203_007243 [Vitis vinifera]
MEEREDLERECVKAREMKAGPRVGSGTQAEEGQDANPHSGKKGRCFFLDQVGAGKFRALIEGLGKEEVQYLCPQRQRSKGGWILLAEALREMEPRPGGQAGQEDKGKLWIPMWGKSFAEVVKQKCSTGDEVVRVKVDSRAIRANLEKLNQCLVGSWNPRRGEGEDLRSWGTQCQKRGG